MSVFCPNIKSEAWLKHTELVGNDLNYLSWIGNKGFAIQYTSKGKVSSLYSDLVKEYKDEKLAAKIKALTFSKSIIEKLGNVKKDSKGEYKIEDVKKLLTLSKQEDVQKSDSEILESIVDKYKIAPKVVFKEGKIVVDDIEYSQSGIISNAVDYQLRVVNALLTLSAPKITKRSEKYGELAEPEVLTFRLNTKERPYLETNIRKQLRGKGVTDNQIDFVFDYMKSNNIQEISTEQLALELAGKYSYSVEVKTAKAKPYTVRDHDNLTEDEANALDFLDEEQLGIQFTERIVDTGKNTSYYSNLTVPGGTNYTENEISTPLITPNIKGHAKFATDKGIGWFRSDEEVLEGNNSTPIGYFFNRTAKVNVDNIGTTGSSNPCGLYHTFNNMTVKLDANWSFVVVNIQLCHAAAGVTYKPIGINKLGVHHISAELLAYIPKRRIGNILHWC